MTDASISALNGIRASLVACRNRFEEYELAHTAKQTPEASAKAKRNREMAELCCDAIVEVDHLIVLADE